MARDSEPPFYLQYGCGLSAPPGWRNFDASPTLRLQRVPVLGRLVAGGEYPRFPGNVEYGDIVRGLPVPAGSCRAIYCSHVLEHLALEDCRKALANTWQCLERDGRFRLVLPDLEQIARDYVSSDGPRASVRFMEQSGLGKTARPAGLKGLLRDWLGNSSHLWMWDFKALSAELRQTGFRDVRRAEYGDSEDPRFREVEDADRWRNGVGIESRR
jgi:hypothetical protein